MMLNLVGTNILQQLVTGLGTPNGTLPRDTTQEFECEFLGSVDTLIAPSKLKMMVYEEPIESSNGLQIYEAVKKDHTYIMTVDVSRGVSNDYSAFALIDITTIPYKVSRKI